MNEHYRPALPESSPSYVLGLQLHRVGVDEIHQFIHQVIVLNQQALVLNLNVHCVNLALKTPWLKDFVNSAQLVFCDGDGVRWGARCLGINPPPKVTYNVWILQLAAFCEQHGHSLYFLGSKPGVAELAKQNLLTRFPKLKILGTHSGYFDKEGPGSEEVIGKINQLAPDILVVGFGMPVQEKWLEQNWKRLKVHIFLNGGAVFDYASGKLAKAPGWMIRHHMEWLYRLYQEPKRLFNRYVVGIPYFFWQIIKETLRKRK